MSRERYYFDELNNDYLFSNLVLTSKHVLKYNKYVIKIFQKCTHLVQAYSSKYIMDLVKLNSHSVVSTCIWNSTKRSQLRNEKMDKIDPVDLESHSLVRLQAMRVSPKEINRAVSNSKIESSRKYLYPADQETKTACNSEADERQPEKSTEARGISDISSLKVKLNLCHDKEVGVEVVSTTVNGNDTKPKEKGAVSDNRFSVGSAEETILTFQSKEGEEREFIPVKETKMSSNSATKSQQSVCLDNYSEMLVHSSEDCKMNIKPNQGSFTSKSCERKMNYPNPRTDTLLFKSMPRMIKSSERLEIEICTSSVIPENPIPSTSPRLLVNSKITKPVADKSLDKYKSAKNANLSVSEPKPGCSRDLRSSAESSITRSQPVAENAKNSITADVMDLRKYRLPFQSPKESPSAKISETFSSPNVEVLVDCINHLSDLIKSREECMQSIYISLIGFRKCLGYLTVHIGNILHVIQHIQMVKKYCVNEDFIKYINGLISMSAILMHNLVSIRLDIEKDIQFWAKCYQEIHIKCLNEPLIINAKPLVNFNVLHKYEDDLKAKWKRIDNAIPILKNRISLFLTTVGDFEMLTKLFVECLINVGVLKLSSTSEL